MPIKSDFAPVEVANEPFPARLLSAIRAHSAADPARLALLNGRQPAEDRCTFGQLHAFSLATASFLHGRGFRQGQVACLALANCWEWAPIFLGCGLLGGAITGANPMFREKELQQQFTDSGCAIVFCSPENLDQIRRSAKAVPAVKTIVLVESGHSLRPSAQQLPDQLPPGVVRFSQVLRTEPVPNVELPLKEFRPERDVLLLPYSSGTTGPPKGVMITHRNVGTMMNIVIDHFRRHFYAYLNPPLVEREENELLLLPFFHCYGFGMMFLTLLVGSTGVVMAGFDGEHFCRTVQRFKIRVLKIVPPILVFLAKSAIVERFDLSCVQVVHSGAAPAGADLCEELKKRLPSVQRIAQGYGMTEMTVATHLPVLDKDRHDSTGKLVANLEMKIVDIQTRQEVEQGMPGELHVRGPTVMLGYLNRPEETAKMVDAEGWLRTGDIAFQDKEGFIHVIDRLKELIKVNGLQVAPAELEDLLLSHPAIQDCAVIGVPDPHSGELPRAFVVPKAGSGLTELEVQQFVKVKAVYYKQLKGGVAFVESIPKSPSGKILRRLLRERHNKEQTGGNQNEGLSKL